SGVRLQLEKCSVQNALNNSGLRQAKGFARQSGLIKGVAFTRIQFGCIGVWRTASCVFDDQVAIPSRGLYRRATAGQLSADGINGSRFRLRFSKRDAGDRFVCRSNERRNVNRGLVESRILGSAIVTTAVQIDPCKSKPGNVAGDIKPIGRVV